MLPRPMLYTGLGTMNSILKLCFYFMIISPYTVSAKIEAMMDCPSYGSKYL